MHSATKLSVQRAELLMQVCNNFFVAHIDTQNQCIMTVINLLHEPHDLGTCQKLRLCITKYFAMNLRKFPKLRTLITDKNSKFFLANTLIPYNFF